jgi:hypothetical protein
MALRDLYLRHTAECSRVDSDGCGTPASTSAVAEPFAMIDVTPPALICSFCWGGPTLASRQGAVDELVCGHSDFTN